MTSKYMASNIGNCHAVNIDTCLLLLNTITEMKM